MRAFLTSYGTSALGSAMASVALAFAMLDDHGSPADLSYVMAARLIPLVVLLLAGGVLGDRFSRRHVLIGADLLRAFAQGGLALAFFAGHPPLALLIGLAVANGVGEAAFTPSFTALVPSLVPASRLGSANAVVGLAQSIATVAGPALAAVLVAVTSPATLLLVDALSYLPSMIVLWRLRVSEPARTKPTIVQDLRDGWDVFWSLPWLWTVTLQFTLFNLLVWGPYLVLGPASADQFYSGARTWGVVLAFYGAGAIVGGLLILGRKPRRPLVVTTAVTVLWAAPSAAFALRLPVAWVCVATLLAGICSAVFNGFWSTTVQQNVPATALSRVLAYVAFGAYSVGPLGLIAAGPLAEAVGIRRVLAVGAVWQVVGCAAMLSLPAIRRLARPAALSRP